MNRPLLPRLALPAVIALSLISAAPAAAAKNDTDRPLEVKVVARQDVADRQVDGLRSAILVELAGNRCGLRLAREGEEAELLARIELLKWRESQRPGGKNVFDPATGQTRRGVRREVELRYRVVVRDSGGAVLVDEEGQHVNGAATRNNWLWDPHLQAVMAARRGAAGQVERWICRAGERLERRERRARRKHRR